MGWALRGPGLAKEARSEAQPAEALDGWWHFFAFLRGEAELAEDCARAERSLVADNDPVEQQRLIRLTQARAALRAGEAGLNGAGAATEYGCNTGHGARDETEHTDSSVPSVAKHTELDRGGVPAPTSTVEHGMASKVANGTDTVESRDEAVDGVLLDTMTTAIKKLIARGKERSYVTVDELNAALPSEQVSSEMIEDTMAMLSEIGINVVESDEGEEAVEGAKAAGKSEDGEEDESGGNVDEANSAAPTTPSACTSARWARWSSCRARARSPSPSASRPGAT